MIPDEADRIIAEKVMGWCRHPCGGDEWWCNETRERTKHTIHSWHPSRDRNQLAEALKECAKGKIEDIYDFVDALMVKLTDPNGLIDGRVSWETTWGPEHMVWMGLTANPADCAVRMAEAVEGDQKGGGE